MSTDTDAQWRLFEIHRASLAAAGKSQARLMATLLGFLALLWGWHFMKPSEMTIQILGATLKSSGLWTIAPAILTVLVLALIGSINVMWPIWKRVRDCGQNLGHAFTWTDMDPNKTLVDFFTYLKLAPEGTVEAAADGKYRFADFSYPAIIAVATMTTALADYPNAPSIYRIYVYVCVALQLVFSFRLWYRAVCRFFGVRKDKTQI